MFLGLLDPDPDQRYGSGSFYHHDKNSKKNLDSYCIVTFFDFFVFENVKYLKNSS
jgi:hypothetical protein